MRAVNDWDRSAPVALTGDAPVAQAVLNFKSAESERFEIFSDRFSGFFKIQSVVLAGVDAVGAFLICIPIVPDGIVVLMAFFSDNLNDGQAVLERESEIAFVVRRYAP